MKKFLTAIFIIILTLTLASVCMASGEDPEFDFKEYAAEKIAPVAVGVATSLVALFGAFQKIKSTVSSLNSSSTAIKELKETAQSTLSGIKGELDEGISRVYEAIKEVPEIKECYDELVSSYKEVKEQNALLLEALKTGFGAIPQAVESGAARKIALLSNNVSQEE